jgi:aspartyl aminopeptidase
VKAPVYERQYRRLAFASGRNGLVWIDVEKSAYHHLSQSEIASDVGGGGTIGLFMSREEMEVIDLGVPLLSMHSPFEMSSKVDVRDFYRTMSACLREQTTL